MTYTNPTFSGDRLYVLNGATATFAGAITLDDSATVVIVGDADLAGVTALHVRGGSRLEIRRHTDALALTAITVEDGSTLEIGTQFADYDSAVSPLTVSGVVSVSGASTLAIERGTSFAGSAVALSGGSRMSFDGQGTDAVGSGALALSGGSSLTLTGSRLTVADSVSALGGSRLIISELGELAPAGDVTVSGANSALELLDGQLTLADSRTLRFADGASWRLGIGTLLATGRAARVIMEATAGNVTLSKPTTFEMGEDADLFFYNDGLDLVAIPGPLTIRRRTPTLPWGSLHLYADNARVENVRVEGAAGAGLTVGAQDVTLRDVVATTSGAGVGVGTDPEGGPSTLTLDNCLLEGNEYGLVARDATVGMKRSTVRASTRHGVLLLAHGRLDPLTTTVIEGSGDVSTSAHGALVHDDAALWTGAVSATARGARDRIEGSEGDAVRVLAGGYAWLGGRPPGATPQLRGHENTILRGAVGPPPYAVNNLGTTTVQARGNWWGIAPPVPGLFNGPVAYGEALTGDLTGGSGYNEPEGGGGPPRQWGSPTTAFAVAGAGLGRHDSDLGATTEFPAALPEELAAWMGALRERLEDTTATAETIEDARALAALAARDGGDVLGEQAANRAALAAWADRLPAEAGVEREAAARAARGLVEVAVAAEDYAEALVLAGLYGPDLPEDEHRLGLGLARATALDGAGERVEAAALVDSLTLAFEGTLDAERLEALAYFRADLDRLIAADSMVVADTVIASLARPAAGSEAEAAAGLNRFEIASLAPNPTSGALRLGLLAPARGRVRVEVFDVLGRRVLALPEAAVEAGPSWHALDGSALPVGTYVLRALALPEAGGASATVARKFAVVR